MLSKEATYQIFSHLAEALPEPKTELNFVNPYTLLVAVVLSAQSTDVGVNKATKELFKSVDNPKKMRNLGLEGLKSYIKTLNYYPTKAKNIMALSDILISDYKGQIPSTREELEGLPGVGRKTANVVLNVAFGVGTIAVDTHIFRVANRTGLAVGKTPREVERKLEECVPADYLFHAHHWLILHGRYTCKARTPLCPQCVIKPWCQYPEKTQ